MRIRIVFAAMLGILLTLSSALGARVVPQLVVGGGYQFVTILANKSDASQTIELELLEGYDQPWSVSFSVNGQQWTGHIITITLAGRTVEKLRLIGGNIPHTGFLRITELTDYRGFVAPIAMQFFYEFRRGEEVIDSVGAPEGVATFGGNAVAFPVERSRTVNTGLAIAPWSPWELSPRPFSYTLQLFNENGQQVGRKTFIFEGHTALFFDEFFPGLPEYFLGWMSVEVSGGMFDHLCITVLRQELTSSGFQLTNVPPDFDIQWQFPFDQSGGSR